MYLYNYNVDAIIVNRIYSTKAMEGYFDKWVIRQQEGLREIEESFSEVPRFYLELQKEEIRMIPVLKNISKKIFQECDPADILFWKEIFIIEKKEEEAKLTILLPFADKEELDLRQEGDELILSIKNETRRFSIPMNFRSMDIMSAKYEDGYLSISF